MRIVAITVLAFLAGVLFMRKHSLNNSPQPDHSNTAQEEHPPVSHHERGVESRSSPPQRPTAPEPQGFQPSSVASPAPAPTARLDKWNENTKLTQTFQLPQDFFSAVGGGSAPNNVECERFFANNGIQVRADFRALSSTLILTGTASELAAAEKVIEDYLKRRLQDLRSRTNRRRPRL